MKKLIKCMLLIFIVSSCVGKPDTPVSEMASIIPRPVEYNAQRGYHQIRDDVGICPDPGMEDIAELIAEDLSKYLGREVVVAKNICAGTILLRNCTSFSEIGDEGYKLNISEKFIEIISPSNAGIFYGYQTLKQMMPVEVYKGEKYEGDISIPCARISDHPKFNWRGMHLDVSRHFMTADEVKAYIDAMVIHKFNVLHWHLTDSQGWRIEIKKYPYLTEQGGWRTDRTELPWSYHDVKLKGTPGAEEPYYGGFYTQEEIKDVVAYAAARGVSIMPEIDLPGHSLAALLLHPEFGCDDYDPYADILYLDNLCPGNEDVYSFLEDVLGEVMELFPFEYFHIGGDEVTKVVWEKCSKCQKRMQEEGLTSVHELQPYFTNRIEKFVNSKGKKIVGWDEILADNLSKNATVMAWRGNYRGAEAANKGHEVIMAAYSDVYLDYYQSLSKYEPKSIGGHINLKKVYSWNPLPNGLRSNAKNLILGAQCQLWTEHITNFDHLMYMAFPRAIALSEKLWSSPDKGNTYSYRDFTKRMEDHYFRLAAAGINHRFQGKDDHIKTIENDDIKSTRVKFEVDDSLFRNGRVQLAITANKKNSAEVRLSNIRLEDETGNVKASIPYISKVGTFNLNNFYTFLNIDYDEDLYFTADVEVLKEGRVRLDVIARKK